MAEVQQNDLELRLLNDDQQPSTDSSTIHQDISGGFWSIICFKPVCKPSCSICFILAAILTTTIVIIQNYVPHFESYWIQWHYINDFYVSQIYTTKNGIQIHYNNQTLLNDTIFSEENNKSIVIYDYLEMNIRLDSTQRINELRIILGPTNQSIVSKLANSISVKTEFYYPYSKEWFAFDTSIEIVDFNNITRINVVSEPKDCIIGWSDDDACYTADQFQIKISNNEKNLTNYVMTNVTLKTHKLRLFKTENLVFLCIFTIITLYNLSKWRKIIHGEGIRLFKRRKPTKFKTLLFTLLTTFYCGLLTAVSLIVDDKWFTQPQYYCIRVNLLALIFYLCLVTYSFRLQAFFPMSWAFVSSKKEAFLNLLKKYLFGSFIFAMVTFVTSLVFGVIALYTDWSVVHLNKWIGTFVWMAVWSVFIYTLIATWKYRDIYQDLKFKNSNHVFDENLFDYQKWKLMMKYTLNFVLFEWFIFMTYAFWCQTWPTMVQDGVLCFYYATIAVYCIINSYFHPISMQKYWECAKCNVYNKQSNHICTVCNLPKPHHKISGMEQNANDDDQMNINIKKNNTIQTSEQQFNAQLFSVEKSEVNSENCDLDRKENCKSLLRIKELCDAFIDSSDESFYAVFDSVSGYSLTALLNDFVHLMELHHLETLNDLLGPCGNKYNCLILHSRLKNNDTESLLISTMKQIHCYLYHNYHRKQQDNELINEFRQKRYCNSNEIEEEKKQHINMSADDQKVEEEENEEEMKEPKDQKEQPQIENEYKNEEKEEEEEEEEKKEIVLTKPINIFPSCICGNVLSKELPTVYGEDSNIYCALCEKSCCNAEFVYHCSKGKNTSEHPNGFDLCEKCALLAFKLEKMKKPKHPKKKRQIVEEYKKYGYNEYGFGSFIYYDLLKPKYDTFKEELLNNKMHCIDIKKWKKILKKAQKYEELDRAKKLINIQNEKSIQIPHLMAIICYTDYDGLCYNFRKSFRKFDCRESDKQVMQRHCHNYYHFGKWLHDTMANYGLLVSQYLSKYKKIIYTGLTGKLLFESLCADFNIPTSTTTDISVAQHFATNDGLNAGLNAGLILQLKPKWEDGSRWDKATCLPVQWISSCPREQELLFFGNFNQLLISDIMFIDDKITQSNDILKAIHVWEMMCDGCLGDSDITVEFSETSCRSLVTLIMFQLIRTYGIDEIDAINDELPELVDIVEGDDSQITDYIKQLFDYICSKRRVFTLQGTWCLWRGSENNDYQQTERYKLLKIFLKDVDDSDIIKSIHCAVCDGNKNLHSSMIVKKNKCEGCKQNKKNDQGYVCNDCNYCLCRICAKMIVNMKILLPNASHQFEVNRLDFIKQNALKIELLRSKGLW